MAMKSNGMLFETSSNKKICVWTLPEGSSPAVRVEVSTGQIVADDLLRIVFKTLGIKESSRAFFGLFKGLEPPIKKFGDDEVIYLPCRSVVSLLRWSFDPVQEARAITTDENSIRLLALQIMTDIRAERLIPTDEQREQLEEYLDPQFPCYKQYVEFARCLDGYGSIAIKNIKLTSNLRLKDGIVGKGTRIDIVCSDRKLIILTDQTGIHVPWRKIRRWTQISNFVSLSFEIYLMEMKAFTWVQIETIQAPYLLQVVSEFVAKMKAEILKPEFQKPAWAKNPTGKRKLSWNLFKKEVFGFEEAEDDLESQFCNLSDEALPSKGTSIASATKQKNKKGSAQDPYLLLEFNKE